MLVHLKMLSATGRTRLPVRSFCPPPVICAQKLNRNRTFFNRCTFSWTLAFNWVTSNMGCNHWSSSFPVINSPGIASEGENWMNTQIPANANKIYLRSIPLFLSQFNLLIQVKSSDCPFFKTTLLYTFILCYYNVAYFRLARVL